jgi:hypothetical protein
MKLFVEIDLTQNMNKRRHLEWALEQIKDGLENFNDEAVFPVGRRTIVDGELKSTGHWEIVL